MISRSKIETELGWTARETFQSGIERTIAWYIENDTWWLPLRLRAYDGERLGLPGMAAAPENKKRAS